jgi:hypothetical protein
MAKVTQPLGSSEARGSVGGLTYNTWRGIGTVKTRSGPATQGTAKQLAAIALIEDANAAWIASSQSDRDLWNRWAAEQRFPDWTGNDKRISGANWFVKCYCNQSRTFGATSLVLPISPIVHFLSNMHFVHPIGELHVIWDYDGSPSDSVYHVEAWATQPPSPGRKPYLKLAQFVDAAPIQDQEITLALAFPPILDVWIRIAKSNGLVGPWSYARWLEP